MHPDLLPELMSGLDRCLQDYILKAKSGSGKYYFILYSFCKKGCPYSNNPNPPELSWPTLQSGPTNWPAQGLLKELPFSEDDYLFSCYRISTIFSSNFAPIDSMQRWVKT